MRGCLRVATPDTQRIEFMSDHGVVKKNAEGCESSDPIKRDLTVLPSFGGRSATRYGAVEIRAKTIDVQNNAFQEEYNGIEICFAGDDGPSGTEDRCPIQTGTR